jgi:hypothetical protein
MRFGYLIIRRGRVRESCDLGGLVAGIRVVYSVRDSCIFIPFCRSIRSRRT